MPVFRKACFPSPHYTGNSISAAGKTFFFKKMKKKMIIIWPARPLKVNKIGDQLTVSKIMLTLAWVRFSIVAINRISLTAY